MVIDPSQSKFLRNRSDDTSTHAQHLHTRSTKPELTLEVPKLLSRCLGNRELALRLINRFYVSVGDLISQMEKALAHLQLESAGLLAHRLKGEAANLGAIFIFENSTAIEDACRDLQLPVAIGALSDLKQNYRLLQEDMPVLIQKVATSDPDPKIPILPKRQSQ